MYTIRKIKNDSAFVCQFAIDDFRTKYAASSLGILWAFVQPIITVIIYWFIFQLGFKNGDVDGYPFILWLISGLLPWFFVSDSITMAVSCLEDYSYLVKKVLFNIKVLPLSRVVSVIFVQIILLIFTTIMFALYGHYPGIYWLQIIYYMIYMIVICVGVAYFTSALYVFFRDILQIITIVLQIVFWTSPIVWQLNIFDKKIQYVLSHNPFFYPVRGYRDALMGNAWFWEYGIANNLYYWLLAVTFLGIGLFVFKKLSHHFADVL